MFLACFVFNFLLIHSHLERTKFKLFEGKYQPDYFEIPAVELFKYE